MVQPDGGHDRDASVPDVGGVEAPAQAHLADDQIGGPPARSQEADGGEQLMMAGPSFVRRHLIGGIAGNGRDLSKGALVDGDTTEPYPFAVSGEVGLG